MKLTAFERMSLINQLSILAAVKKTDEYANSIQILQEGYEIFFDDVMHLYKSMSDEQCHLTMEVLDMYRVISDYLTNHPDDVETAKIPWVQFRGWDANDSYEGACLSFTRFLIDKQGKWSEQKGREKQTDGFNSHMPTRDLYSRMLQTWSSLGKPCPMTKEHVTAILSRDAK